MEGELTNVQVKIEPVDPFEAEVSLREEDGEVQINDNPSDNFVEIKEEPIDLNIKIEPERFENPYEHHEQILPDINAYYNEHSNDGETVSTSHNNKNKETSKEDESDEEYLPHKSKKKKKKETNVKPTKLKTTKTPPKVPEGQKYSDEILANIEIVTIDEAERVKEHHDLFSSRKHMNYSCEPCALGFVVESAYHMHMKIHSPENGEHKCDICFARVKTADVLYRHKLRHYRRYRCGICLLQLRDKDTVAAHVMREHLGAAFLCSHCGRDFKRPQYLKRHVEQMHTRPLHLVCPVCGRVFYERGWYRCHVRTHNEEVRKNVDRKAICSECGREFRNKAYLVRHLQTHEDRDPVVCKLCSRTFKNIDVLRVHYRQHHAQLRYNEDGSEILNRAIRTYSGSAPLRERGPHLNTTCMQCGRVLTTRAMLMRHTQRMHTDHTRKFQCDYCKKWYFTKAEVRSHIEWSHLQQRRHACPCGRVFRTPARLRQHACSVHLQIEQPRDKSCPICGKMFANQQVLTRHVRGHSGETYPCTECGQKFKTQSYVKVHYKLKHLNMTRAEIKAQTKRKLIMIDNMDEVMNARIKHAKANLSNVDPLNIERVELPDIQGIKPDPDLVVPSFETFLDIPREY